MNINWTPMYGIDFPAQEGVDAEGNHYLMTANRECVICTLSDGRKAVGWTAKQALKAAKSMPRFSLGRLLITPAATYFLSENGVAASRLIDRHASGDWGDLTEEDKLENEQSVDQGYRVMSSYKVGNGIVWVITEADRSATTVLLPSDN